ncbi:MAG: Xaa-Pro peptidase family protein [Pseudomonadota bacterium]
MKRAKLIYGVPDLNPDLYYITRLKMGDPTTCLVANGKSYLFIGGFEYPRAYREAHVDKVVNCDIYVERAKKKFGKSTMLNTLDLFLKDLKVKELEMPQESSFYLVDCLRKSGFKVIAGDKPFFQERLVKSAEEVREITRLQKLNFAAMDLAREMLKKSRIKGDKLFLRGKILTSEMVRDAIDTFLFEKGCLATSTIVACGKQGIDPHERGKGPLRPHQSIIIDIFPQSKESRYCADATRTFCKGRPTDALIRMYDVVKKGQELGLSKIKAGVNGKVVHEAICKYFERKGYKLKVLKHRNEGFIHGTGHGLGLEVHEEPVRIATVDCKIKKGFVVTVEPGLYYSDIGGVRIEDLVYVTSSGCDVLGKYPKNLIVS